MNGWLILQALWLFLPAYVANMSPVFSAKLMPKWSRPIDNGRVHKDGSRVLGDGKTWRGLVGGALAAGLTALAMTFVAPAYDASGWLAGWDFGAKGYPGGAIGTSPTCPDAEDAGPCRVDVWYSSRVAVFFFGAIVGLMALTGDAVESYFKRRSGRPRGSPWIPFDQLDFVVFGLIGMIIAAPLLTPGWVFAALFGSWIVLTTLLAGTVALHLLVNRIGYWLKLKEVPW